MKEFRVELTCVGAIVKMTLYKGILLLKEVDIHLTDPHRVQQVVHAIRAWEGEFSTVLDADSFSDIEDYRILEMMEDVLVYLDMLRGIFQELDQLDEQLGYDRSNGGETIH